MTGKSRSNSIDSNEGRKRLSSNSSIEIIYLEDDFNNEKNNKNKIIIIDNINKRRNRDVYYHDDYKIECSPNPSNVLKYMKEFLKHRESNNK